MEVLTDLYLETTLKYPQYLGMLTVYKRLDSLWQRTAINQLKWHRFVVGKAITYEDFIKETGFKVRYNDGWE